MSRLAIVVVAGLLAGCGLRSASTSLRYLNHAPLGPQTARGLVVMLPGFGDRATHFEQYGFVEATQAQGDWDVLVADAHFGYYRAAEVVKRLRQDIIGPARALGYRNIWLVGVSMGGFGASSYASLYPEEISGLVLISPYLGEHEGDLAAIRAAGAEEDREVRTSNVPPAELELRIWTYLREKAADKSSNLYLIYGSEEKDGAHERLAALMNKERVHVEPGGHKWRVWSPAFKAVSPAALGATAASGASAGTKKEGSRIRRRRESQALR